MNSHVFPSRGGVGVSSPRDRAKRAWVINVSRGRYSRANFCAHKQRHEKSDKCNDNVCGEHSLLRPSLVGKKKGGRGVEIQKDCCLLVSFVLINQDEKARDYIDKFSKECVVREGSGLF